MRESHCRPSPHSPASLQREPAFSDGGASTLESAVHPHRAVPVAVPPCETVLRRPQRPGTRNAFTFGNRSAARPFGTPSADLSACSQRPLGPLPQNRPCAITGSVLFTPAVIELSYIVQISSTENRVPAVRKLWTTNLACGSPRKTRKKLPVW